jgi:serine/threonine protein kinase
MDVAIKRTTEHMEYTMMSSLLDKYSEENWPRGVVRVYGVSKAGDEYLLVMERCTADLLEYWRQVGTEKGTGSGAIFHVVDICEGYHHLLEEGWVHDDVKLSNILVSRRNNHAVLIDFGRMEPTTTKRRYWIVRPLFSTIKVFRSILSGWVTLDVREKQIVDKSISWLNDILTKEKDTTMHGIQDWTDFNEFMRWIRSLRTRIYTFE